MKSWMVHEKIDSELLFFLLQKISKENSEIKEKIEIVNI